MHIGIVNISTDQAKGSALSREGTVTGGKESLTLAKGGVERYLHRMAQR